VSSANVGRATTEVASANMGRATTKMSPAATTMTASAASG